MGNEEMREMWFDFAHQPGDEGDEGQELTHTQCPMPTCPERSRRDAQCPMSNAQFPMPNAQCPMPNN
ncbi:hypothetical protein LC613_08040 [Nostoc sphaeroides CHAB 2801]|uniref:hypothetical protein n=1 Tax=Nostoc sphaeroides TaxID=446679 RepID=UPI0011C17835|nr:hypothetical protein [Nostoc sphaeroides]MCC5628077.1 hypothetical protein [Nostoc sphaeroides CHAB 2801]